MISWKHVQGRQPKVNTAAPAKDGARSPDPVSPGAEEDGKRRSFLEKVKSGLMAKKFNQTDREAEKRYEEFIKETSVKSHTANLTPEDVDLVNEFILRMRKQLCPKGKEPDEWPPPDYAKTMPSDFLQLSIQVLPTHVEQCTERVKEQATTVVRPASPKSHIVSFRDTEVCQLQRAVEPPRDVPEPFWDTPLGKALKNLRKALVQVHQDLEEAVAKVNEGTPSQAELPAGAPTEKHQDLKKK